MFSLCCFYWRLLVWFSPCQDAFDLSSLFVGNFRCSRCSNCPSQSPSSLWVCWMHCLWAPSVPMPIHDSFAYKCFFPRTSSVIIKSKAGQHQRREILVVAKNYLNLGAFQCTLATPGILSLIFLHVCSICCLCVCCALSSVLPGGLYMFHHSQCMSNLFRYASWRPENAIFCCCWAEIQD